MKMKFQFLAILLVFMAGLLGPASIFTGNDQFRNQLNQSNKNFFIENKGQWPPEVKYLARVGGMNAWITNSGVVYDYFRVNKNYTETQLMQLTPDKRDEFERKNTIINGHVVKMSLVDANTSAVQQGNNKKIGYYNYFLGNDKSKWAGNVPLFGDIEQNEIYKNINVKYYFDRNSIRYDYIIKPGADLSQLRLKFEGQESIKINNSGELIIKTSLGDVTNGKLFSYQIDNGKQKEITCGFAQNKDGTICLNPAAYDKNKELIIDPLVYSTYIGGSGDEYALSIAADAAGNAYITGETTSSNYPTTTGAYSISFGGYYDVFVTKLNPEGNSLLYSTFIGGQEWDAGTSITIDLNGNSYITGWTYSPEYPTTSNAYQTLNGGGGYPYQDAFVTKLNPAGNSLLYSTFIGGNKFDVGYSIAIDPVGDVYITGFTSSADYPITSGAFQTTYGGGTYPVTDAFVSKLHLAGNGVNDLLYSTYIGGPDDERGYSIAIDPLKNVYITGYTNSSSGFPITPSSAFMPTIQGDYDAFLTKLNLSGNGPNDLVYSTYFGGTGLDRALSLAIDPLGDVYITGNTSSSNFPVTAGAFQTTYGGNPYDAFVTKFHNPLGNSLVYSTFIGGNNNDIGRSIVIGSFEWLGNQYYNACITGLSASPDYPATPGAYNRNNSGDNDAVVTELNSFGTSLAYSTFIGGSNYEIGYSIAMPSYNKVYITGNTWSPNYPATPAAYMTTYSGGYDGFVSELTFDVGTLNSPLSLGYWKNHPDKWLAQLPMMLGTLNTYTQSQLLSIFCTPVRTDASLVLAYQLIAAKLNVANNSPLPAEVQIAITNSDAAIGQVIIPAGIKPNSDLGKTMLSLAAILDQYNNNLLTPDYKHEQMPLADPSKLNDQSGLVDDNFKLLGNFPNPFNPSTRISFILPEANFVTLKIYNSVGQLVRTLVNENMNKGYHTLEWNAVNDNGSQLAAGIYLYRLQAGNFAQTSKMIFMK